MSDFVKELNFDGDTFNDMKRDMNFVLQRLLGNMQEKECQEGTLTLKLDVSLTREYVPNYNPNIPGESREIAKPKFSHKVTSQMKVEDMKKGNLDTEMELFLNDETGEYEMRPVADTTQRSIFDADYRDVTEPGPAGIEPDIGPGYIEYPELPGEVVDEHALPGPVEEYEDADESVYDDSTGDNLEDTQFTDETDLDGAETVQRLQAALRKTKPTPKTMSMDMMNQRRKSK